jgi:hypothetical protein
MLLALTVLSLSSPAHAGPLGADDFDDIAQGYYFNGPMPRAWGSIDSFDWSSGGPVGFEVQALPSSGQALGNYGAGLTFTFDEPVNHIAIDAIADLSAGCEGWGYFDRDGNHYDAGESLVWIDVFDAAGNPIHDGTYDFVFDGSQPVPETSRAQIRYTHPSADIAAFGLHWSGPCMIYADDLAYGKPAVDVLGTCPGPMDVAFSNFTPGADIEVYTAAGAGTTTLTSGTCAGTELDLDSTARLRTVLTADANGEITVSRNFRRAACGLTMTAVDLSICETSGADLLP